MKDIVIFKKTLLLICILTITSFLTASFCDVHKIGVGRVLEEAEKFGYKQGADLLCFNNCTYYLLLKMHGGSIVGRLIIHDARGNLKERYRMVAPDKIHITSLGQQENGPLNLPFVTVQKSSLPSRVILFIEQRIKDYRN